MDSLIASNFLDLETVSDLGWMTTFSALRGYRGGEPPPNLAVARDYKMSEFITDILTPDGGMKDLAGFRREEKERLFTDFVTHRSAPSLPGGISDECYDEIPATFFRFALDRELYREFFASGNARRALLLERIDPETGTLGFPGGNRDSKYVLGIMACYARDPGCKWLWDHLPEVVGARGYFQERYIGPVLRYNPDHTAPEAPPAGVAGVRFAPTPVDNAPVVLTRKNYQFAAIVEGYGRDDDYLCVNGTRFTAPSGLLATLASGGTVWLGYASRNGDSNTRFDLNTASAVRTDGTPGAGAFDDTSECLGSATRRPAWLCASGSGCRRTSTGRATSSGSGTAFLPSGTGSPRGRAAPIRLRSHGIRPVPARAAAAASPLRPLRAPCA